MSVGQANMDVVDQAIAWQVRLADASPQEWHDFVAWLEASPEHAAAFDSIATDDLLVGMVAQNEPPITAVLSAAAPSAPKQRRRIGTWAMGGGGALAAAAIAASLVFSWPGSDQALYTVVTAAGQHRILTLADGTRIELNGGTRLTLDRSRSRRATLESGQAMFHVRHDSAVPFEVLAGDASLRDLGTVFEVTRDAERLSVQVVEGAVMFRPDHERILLKPGTSLKRQNATAPLILNRVAAEDIGSWRGGRLTFSEVICPHGVDRLVC